MHIIVIILYIVKEIAVVLVIHFLENIVKNKIFKRKHTKK